MPRERLTHWAAVMAAAVGVGGYVWQGSSWWLAVSLIGMAVVIMADRDDD